MELVGAALGDDVDHRPSGAAILGGIVAAQHGHFFESVAQPRLNLLAGDRVVIVVGAVDQLIVRARSQPVDVEFRALDESACEHSWIGDTRKREDKIHWIECGHRQIDYLARLERACTRAVLLLQDDGRVRIHIHHFSLGAYFQCEVGRRGLRRFYCDVVTRGGLESSGADVDLI